MDNIQLEDLKRVELGPRDVVVLHVKRKVSDSEKVRIGNSLHHLWPNNRSLIVDDDMELSVVVQAEEVADAELSGSVAGVCEMSEET